MPFGSGNPRTSLLRGREDRGEPNGGWNGAWRAGAPFAEEGGTREGREGPNVPHRHRERMEDKGSFPGTLGIERGARHQLIFGVAPSPQERKQLPKPKKFRQTLGKEKGRAGPIETKLITLFPLPATQGKGNKDDLGL